MLEWEAGEVARWATAAGNRAVAAPGHTGEDAASSIEASGFRVCRDHLRTKRKTEENDTGCRSQLQRTRCRRRCAQELFSRELKTLR